MAAAGDRLHALPVDLDPRGLVALPAPALRGADLVHDALAQHVGKRLAEAAQQRIAERVHPDVVVFVEAAGLAELAALALAAVVGADADLPEMVDLVGFAEDLALPFAVHVEQMAPGDLRVVRAGEMLAVDAFADRLVDIGDQPIGDGEARQHRKIALGDREGHVGALDIAPFGDDLAAVQHDAGRPAARLDRPDDLGPRTGLVPFTIPDIGAVRIEHAARPGGVVSLREVDGGLEMGGRKGVRQGGDSGSGTGPGRLSIAARGRLACWGTPCSGG